MHKDSIFFKVYNSPLFSPKFLGFLAIIIISMIVSLVFTQMPFLILFTMILFSTLPALQFISLFVFEGLSIKIKKLIEAFLNLLFVLGLLNWAYNFYVFLCDTLNIKMFKIYTIFVSLLLLNYVLVSKYIFYLKINFVPLPWYIILLYAFAILGLILRSFTTFSWLIIPFIFSNYPTIGLLLCPPPLPEEATPASPATPHTVHSPRYGGFFPRHNHTHHHSHYNPPQIPKSNFYRNCGLTVGVIGVGCSIFACYTYHQTAAAAIKQVEIAKKQLEASQRQADINAVDAGLISKETYYLRHPKDKPPINS